jgi:L-lactate dehydrogenase
VNPREVEAQVVGEHGTSAVFLWSSARVGGMRVVDMVAQRGIPFDTFRQTVEHDVRYANIAIIEGIGASQYGIGMVSARIAEIVLRDERAVFPIGSFNPRYGVTLSLPSVLGRDGIAQILHPEMSAEEQDGLGRSAQALKTAGSRLFKSSRKEQAA